MAKCERNSSFLRVLVAASFLLLAGVESPGTVAAKAITRTRVKTWCQGAWSRQTGCFALRRFQRHNDSSAIPRNEEVLLTTPEGMWIVVSAEMGAKPIANDSLPVGEQWTFASGKLMIQTPGVGREQFSYTLDPSRRLAEINLKKLTSPEMPPTGWLGIYRIDGNILTICAFPDIAENMPRPSDFQTAPDDLQVLWKLKRVVIARPSTTTGTGCPAPATLDNRRD